ncbi:MAG: NAD(P)H-dependent oxidoreductase [Pseudomonadota bacterium]
MGTGPMKILTIHSSGRHTGSTTRKLAAAFVAAVTQRSTGVQETVRDLTDGIPFVDEAWMAANFTAPEERDAAKNAALSFSDALVEELEAADVIVIGVPIYNFAVPALLKAWVDQVARAKRTFMYTPEGPRGLLKGKTAVLVVASGGTELDSAIDFATPYMRHALAFLGIDDVHVIAADRQMADAEAAAARANTALTRVAEALADQHASGSGSGVRRAQLNEAVA